MSVYTLEEVSKKSSHFWGTIKERTLRNQNNWGMMGIEISVLFAKKSMTINETCRQFALSYYSYQDNSVNIHSSVYGFLSRIIFYFKKIYNVNIKIENILWECQLDEGFYWVLVVDKKTNKTLVFESL